MNNFKMTHKLIMTAVIAAASLVSAMAHGSNPLLGKRNTPYGVPSFEKIKPEHYKPAFLQAMQEQDAEIKAITSSKEKASFTNTVAALDKSGGLLRSVSATFFGISSAQSAPELLALQTELSPLLSKHNDLISMNDQLFERIKSLYDKKEQLALTKEQNKLLSDLYKSFVRNGATLPEAKKDQLKKLNEEISGLQNKFAQNMLAETGAFQLIIDNKEELAGLPDDLVAAAAIRATKAGKEGSWIFGLDNPSIMPFLQFADSRELREKMLTGYLMRCNNNNDKDNKELIVRLISLRNEKAKLLGFENFAFLALDDRMAKKPEAVYELLDQIWTPAKVVATQEAADMQDMIGSKFVLQSWDWRYYSEKIKQEKFNLSEEEIRPYFEANNVRDGIFWVCQQLFDISFTELSNIPLPHPDARAFLCKDADGKTELGILYIDLFARPGFKRGGAWCGSYRTQTYDKTKRVLPITTIVCNFTAPIGDKAALLTMDETETFFHEFGHALHNLFKDVNYYGVAGVPRDFVELPSQIMEHWAFQPQSLHKYAKHYQTGEVIPQDLIDKMEKASKFGQGFKTMEYLGASYLDMDYHVASNPEKINILDFENQSLYTNRGLLSQIPPRYRSTYFQHTMAGGYTAGYYSYIWAEVLDADGFSAFEETGNIFDKATAAKFRKYVLAPGGIDDAMDMYVNFRGSKPSIDALLKNRGLK